MSRPVPLVLVAVVLAACSGAPSGDGAAEVDVLPIEDVLADAIVVTPDPSGTAATLRVTTTIPLACAVVYGDDDGLGSLATDDDMSGGAHTDHAPVMRGLEPETEYRYVLQGSDANGNLYRSELRTFTTPAASGPERPGENVATQGTVVDVSSEFSADFRAEHAIDGDPATAWSSDGDGDGAWIVVELPAPTEIVGVGLRSRSMGDGSSVIERYELTVDDGEMLGPFEADPDGLSIATTTASGTRFRVDAVETSGGNTGIVELELHRRP